MVSVQHELDHMENNDEYAVFQNYGYMGLYGGLKAADIHTRKGLKKGKRYWTTWVVQN